LRSMEAEQVMARVREIARCANDPEMAHVKLDELLKDVLRQIASGCPDPAGLAREALKADDLPFDRWYA